MLRAELLGQLVAAQFDLEAVINEIGSNAAALSDSKAQLQLLSALQRQIGSASPAALAGLRGEIVATVSAAHAVAQQSRATANADDKPDRAMTAAEARQAIIDVGRDVFDRQKLDPYLRFASPEDEEAYRKREEENSKAYERELAKGTAEGNRRAAEILRAQLDDARAHGAGDSPDFNALSQRIDNAQAALNTPERQPSSVAHTGGIVADDPDAEMELDDVLATLRSAGITTPEQTTGAPIHGLTSDARIASNERDVGSGRLG